MHIFQKEDENLKAGVVNNHEDFIRQSHDFLTMLDYWGINTGKYGSDEGVVIEILENRIRYIREIFASQKAYLQGMDVAQSEPRKLN